MALAFGRGPSLCMVRVELLGGPQDGFLTELEEDELEESAYLAYDDEFYVRGNWARKNQLVYAHTSLNMEAFLAE